MLASGAAVLARSVCKDEESQAARATAAMTDASRERMEGMAVNEKEIAN